MNVGDIVMLKSGSPKMTISNIDAEHIFVVYWDEMCQDFKRCLLIPEVLIEVSTDEGVA